MKLSIPIAAGHNLVIFPFSQQFFWVFRPCTSSAVLWHLEAVFPEDHSGTLYRPCLSLTEVLIFEWNPYLNKYWIYLFFSFVYYVHARNKSPYNLLDHPQPITPDALCLRPSFCFRYSSSFNFSNFPSSLHVISRSACVTISILRSILHPSEWRNPCMIRCLAGYCIMECNLDNKPTYALVFILMGLIPGLSFD